MPLSIVSLNKARRRLIDMHYRAKVGHVGGNLSCLDAMMLIHHEYLGKNDRFILSKGHSAGALYVTLWSLGRLTDGDLDRFHQDDTSPRRTSAGERYSGYPLRHRQSGARSLARGRVGSGGEATARQSTRVLLDLRWRMAGGLNP